MVIKQTQLVIFVLLLGLGLLLLDSFGNPNSVQKLLHIPSYIISLSLLLFSIFYRLKYGLTLPRRILQILDFMAIASILGTAALSIFDYQSPPNTLYSLTRLHQTRLLIVSIYLFHMALIWKTSDWWRKYWKFVVFGYPFMAIGWILLTRIFPFDAFFHLAKEDTLFEIIQFLILFAGAVLSGWAAWILRNVAKPLVVAFFVVTAFGFALVAGEEISWGQRILGIEPNETVLEHNYQAEYTLHNLKFVHHKVFYMYIVLCIVALTVTWLTRFVTGLKKITRFMPSGLLFGYFLIPLRIYYGQFEGELTLPWQEAAEIFFYLGVVLWVAQLTLLNKKVQKTISR